MSQNEKTKTKKKNNAKKKKINIEPFIRGKIRRVLNKTRTFRINGTFRLEIRRGAA